MACISLPNPQVSGAKVDLASKLSATLIQQGKHLSNNIYQLPLEKNQLAISLHTLSDFEVATLKKKIKDKHAFKVKDKSLIVRVGNIQSETIHVGIYSDIQDESVAAVTLIDPLTANETPFLEVADSVPGYLINASKSSEKVYIHVGSTHWNISSNHPIMCIPSLKVLNPLNIFHYIENFEESEISFIINKGHFKTTSDLFEIQHMLADKTRYDIFVSRTNIQLKDGFKADGSLNVANYYSQDEDYISQKDIVNSGKIAETILSQKIFEKFNPIEAAKANLCEVKEIANLKDIKFPKSSLPFISDCSPTGLGKSVDLKKHLISYLAKKPSLFSQDHRAILIVPNFKNIPASLLIRDDVVLSWGRQSEDFGVFKKGEYITFQKLAEAEKGSTLLKHFEATCGSTRMTNAEKDQCPYCGKKLEDCEYHKHTLQAKEGFPGKKLIITTLGNAGNLFDYLLPKTSEKFHIIEDDLNYVNDSIQIDLKSSDLWLYQLADINHSYGVNFSDDVYQATIEAIVASLTEDKFRVTKESFLKNQGIALPNKQDVLESITDTENCISYEQAAKLLKRSSPTDLSDTIYHNSEISEVRKIKDHVIKTLQGHYTELDLIGFDRLDWAKMSKLCKQHRNLFKVMEAVYKPEYEYLVSSQKVSESSGFYQFSTKLRVKKESNVIDMQGNTYFDEESDGADDIVTVPVFASLNKTNIIFNVSKTTPERYENFAATLLRISADDFFESHRTVGKKPDLVVYRPTDFKPQYVRVKGSSQINELKNLAPNASAKYISETIRNELDLKLSAIRHVHPEVAIPDKIKHAVFDSKHLKAKATKLLQAKNVNDLMFKQYFGDEVGSNDLFLQNYNCLTLRKTKLQNISSLLIFQGRDTGTHIGKVQVPEVGKVLIVNGGINLARQQIQLNQAYGRLRANRKDRDTLAFIDENEFVNVNIADVLEIDLSINVQINSEIKHREYEDKAEWNEEHVAEANAYIILNALHRTNKSILTWHDWTKEFKKFGKTSGYAEVTRLFNDPSILRISKGGLITRKRMLTAALKVVSYYLIWQNRKKLNLKLLTNTAKLNTKITNPLEVLETLKEYSEQLQELIAGKEASYIKQYPENYSNVVAMSNYQPEIKIPDTMKYKSDADITIAYTLRSADNFERPELEPSAIRA